MRTWRFLQGVSIAFCAEPCISYGWDVCLPVCLSDCLTVCLSVRLSHAGTDRTVSKRRMLGHTFHQAMMMLVVMIVVSVFFFTKGDCMPMTIVSAGVRVMRIFTEIPGEGLSNDSGGLSRTVIFSVFADY